MSATEQAIRQAAIELIAQRGYDAMTLRGLAAHAGVNTSTLYLYFKGKQELLTSLILDYYEQLQDAWLLARPSLSSARAAWSAFVRSHVAYHLHHTQQGRLGNLELRCIEEAAQEEALQARELYLSEIRKIIEQGIAEEDFECPDPERYAHILFDLLTRSAGWYQRAGGLTQDEITWHYLSITSKLLEPTQSRRSR
ncbi:transcriptional repressor BetI [compost metagenome]